MSLSEKLTNWRSIAIYGTAGAIGAGLLYKYFLVPKTQLQADLSAINLKRVSKEEVIQAFEGNYEKIAVIATELAMEVRSKLADAGVNPDNPSPHMLEIVKAEHQKKDSKFSKKLKRKKVETFKLMGFEFADFYRSVDEFIENGDKEILHLFRRETDTVNNAYAGVPPPIPEEAHKTVEELSEPIVIDIFCSVICSNVREILRVVDQLIIELEKDPQLDLQEHPLVKEALDNLEHVDEKPFIVERLPLVKYAELGYHLKLNKICAHEEEAKMRISEIGGLARIIGSMLVNGDISKEKSADLRKKFETEIENLKEMFRKKKKQHLSGI